jgi:hypothetical protein
LLATVTLHVASPQFEKAGAQRAFSSSIKAMGGAVMVDNVLRFGAGSLIKREHFERTRRQPSTPTRRGGLSDRQSWDKTGGGRGFMPPSILEVTPRWTRRSNRVDLSMFFAPIASLRNGFNDLLRALPGDEFVLSPSSAN